jgi:hypothetical protein
MIHHFSDLSTILPVARCSFVAWARFAGAAALTLAVTGLEIWLRVPVRPVFNQILAFKRPVHAI